MSETTGPGPSPHETNHPIAEARETVDTIANTARQTAKATWTSAKERFPDLKAFEKYARENPIRATLIAFALGFILALFLRK